MIARRGLTLLEVLLAISLLASLAGITAHLARDLRAASEKNENSPPFGTATQDLRETSNRLLRSTELPVRAWEVGRSETVLAGINRSDNDRFITATVERLPCEGCPDSIGLFELQDGGASIVRFAEVAPQPREQVQ